jgi:hypothetical protein
VSTEMKKEENYEEEEKISPRANGNGYEKWGI